MKYNGKIKDPKDLVTKEFVEEGISNIAEASAEKKGLMSPKDKEKLDNISFFVEGKTLNLGIK